MNFKTSPHEYAHPTVCQSERPRPQGKNRPNFDRLAATNVFVVNLSPGRFIAMLLSWLIYWLRMRGLSRTSR
jgi:hypothetical protein